MSKIGLKQARAAQHLSINPEAQYTKMCWPSCGNDSHTLRIVKEPWGVGLAARSRWSIRFIDAAQSPGPPQGYRRPGGGAANGASCLSLCFLSLAFRAKTLALGCSRAAAAQRARPQRHYHGRETTDGKSTNCDKILSGRSRSRWRDWRVQRISLNCGSGEQESSLARTHARSASP